MNIRIITQPISRTFLQEIANERYGDMVKAVVDVEKEIIGLGGELHSDIEAEMLNAKSIQKNLWGVNFYTEIEGEDFLEFDSLINIRPTQNNRSRDVEDENIKNKIRNIVNKLILKNE